MKYRALYDYTVKNGGVTFRVKDYPEKIVMPAKGYVVGGYGDNATAIFDVDDTEAFDESIDRFLFHSRNDGYKYIGTWINEGKVYIENVEVLKNKDFAMGTAYGRGEKAVYDLAAKKEIFLKV
jgi:hypothetical protein